ncbi:MAG: hypothetical protein ACRDFS_09145 [Chloroflexota bacterium]
MTADRQQTDDREGTAHGSTVGLALAAGALAALGIGLVVQQIMDRRLSRPEVARLKFYRYLRERGHLES